jgi:hypothetical protein
MHGKCIECEARARAADEEVDDFRRGEVPNSEGRTADERGKDEEDASSNSDDEGNSSLTSRSVWSSMS